MWILAPLSGIEPTPPASEGEALATRSPGKSRGHHFTGRKLSGEAQKLSPGPRLWMPEQGKDLNPSLGVSRRQATHCSPPPA